MSIDFKPGLYGLLGPNGSGKSTMINIVTCGVKQSSGIVLWNNKTVNISNREFFSILGFMPQQQNLYDGFTGKKF